jgi:hypothetical protein
MVQDNGGLTHSVVQTWRIRYGELQEEPQVCPELDMIGRVMMS